ncbi:hypothetical protein CABS03_12328 [Colletotrichum abscissum]|uniref:Major facilitator superfamily (MFS) profile domain-containing protein n=1 Tax=Colletotrichum abscissum TaxID=1671311 RepID=A0A9Q0B078_9PEZI|nr:hypothetical protein CABS02_11472 [Colletotrichum abscissum]
MGQWRSAGPSLMAYLYKAFTVTRVSLGATVVRLFSTIYTSGIPGLQGEFHVSKLVALLGLTTSLLGMAAGSLVVAPMSESLGRRPLYIASMAAFLALVLPSALAESIATVIATRLFGGFFGSTMMSNSPATVNDIVSDKHRVLALGFWFVGPANGPVYGSLIGGFVYQRKGWRWTNWIVSIIGSVVFVLLASVKETYAPVLLKRRAAEKSKATGDDRWWTRYDHGQGLWPLLKINLYRPLKMMCTEPICMFWNTYIGIVYATLCLCFVAYLIAFQQERSWAPGIGGLAFLGIGCGTLIPIAAEPLLRRIVNLHQKDPATGNVKPEARVSIVCIGAVLLAIGQFWFAWTCQTWNTLDRSHSCWCSIRCRKRLHFHLRRQLHGSVLWHLRNISVNRDHGAQKYNGRVSAACWAINVWDAGIELGWDIAGSC